VCFELRFDVLQLLEQPPAFLGNKSIRRGRRRSYFVDVDDQSLCQVLPVIISTALNTGAVAWMFEGPLVGHIAHGRCL
jgi:hypothetical protein